MPIDDDSFQKDGNLSDTKEQNFHDEDKLQFSAIVIGKEVTCEFVLRI
jgi:hypothetical protein